jgi:alkylation response protein AidB-like acyl-CoA dehydrogenase
MDFSYTEEQEAVQALASQIFSENVSNERLIELTKSGEWFDMALWKQLVESNLSSLTIPESLGGGGLGLTELCLVLEEQGRHVAPVPLLATTALGALPIAEFGSDAQKKRWLVPVVEEGAVLTAALHELGSSDPSAPGVTATKDGDGFELAGVKDCVPAAGLARSILVAARTEEGVGVFVVDPGTDGVRIEEQVVTHHEPQGRLVLDGVRVGADDVLGDPAQGAEIVDWMLERARLAVCAIQLGVADGALAATAAYVSERKQFGRPIATFQGVALRAADAFIDVQGMRATLTQAVWRLEQGLPAEAEIAAAKFWAADGARRVVHTAQHLHGGIGSDIEYPIHRYFYWSAQNELLFGGAKQQLARIGALLVSDAYQPQA